MLGDGRVVVSARGVWDARGEPKDVLDTLGRLNKHFREGCSGSRARPDHSTITGWEISLYFARTVGQPVGELQKAIKRL